MKKIFSLALAMMLLRLGLSAAESLNRAPVAVMTKTGVLVSWRSLTGDAAALAFSVSRNGVLLESNISDCTNYLDADGQAGDVYTISDGTGTCTATAWENMHIDFDVPRPAAIKSGNTTGRYRPDDATVGDVDGDGTYELIMKWMPDNGRDNGSDGYSSPCIIDCYELDYATGVATQRWRINLGPNIRTGNHYTQLVVYDLNGDGRAELLCKTAPGSKDGQGNYVTAAATDNAIRSINNTQNLVNSKGRILSGEELLTVFNGETGAAMHTVWYNPNRAFGLGNSNMAYGSWGDTSGNRGERFNACVAHLDGLNSNATAIFQRGYYTRCYIWAVDWNGTALTTRWLHRGTAASAWDVVNAQGSVIDSGTGKSSYGQGVHSISVGDVDDDGYDEICIGAATIDHNGSLLCSTGMGHGDAIHLGHLVPGRPGMQVMMPHEEKNSKCTYGYDVHDAATGAILCSANSTGDNGRGLAGDFYPANPGWEFWSSADGNSYKCSDGTVVASKKADTDFRIYWTGDPYDQTFDGRYDSNTGKCAPRIRNWKTSGSWNTFQEFAAYDSPQTTNTTKATPILQADLLGDWREELIMVQYEADWSAPTCRLMVFSTPEPTAYKVPCLMQDHLYRMGIVWQNSSYNQPPHLGYDLAAYLGVNGATYTTQTANNAPDATPAPVPGTGEENLATPSEDRASVTGTCYTAGTYGELTASTSGEYLKIRTNTHGDSLCFFVNPGYIITSVSVTAYSNNSSTTADRSITMSGMYIDDAPTSVLAPVVFPGGTAGQNPTTAKAVGLNATHSVKLAFDNSLITTSEVDPAGKNKQIMAKVVFTYRLHTTALDEVSPYPVRNDDRIYDLLGRTITQPIPGHLYIQNGKKFLYR